MKGEGRKSSITAKNRQSHPLMKLYNAYCLDIEIVVQSFPWFVATIVEGIVRWQSSCRSGATRLWRTDLSATKPGFMERLSVLVNLLDKTCASRVRIALLRPQYFTEARSTRPIVVDLKGIETLNSVLCLIVIYDIYILSKIY